MVKKNACFLQNDAKKNSGILTNEPNSFFTHFEKCDKHQNQSILKTKNKE